MRWPSPWSLGVAAPVVAATTFGVVALLGGGPTDGARPRAAPGAELFATQCSSCHGLDGRGVEGRGPSLESEGEAAADFVLRTGRMPLAAPGLQARRGPVRYSEEEIVALVAYVGTIGDGPDIPVVDTAGADVARGGELYRLNCAACHVSSGAGAPIGGGQIAPNLTEATPTQIGEAIRVGPGSMPVFAFSSSEIDDVAAYIQVLDRENTTGANRFGGAGPVAEGLAAWILALVPLVFLTRWIGRPKEGRDRPVDRSDDDTPAEAAP
jgi:ubiquinol-cytochrome c reductase cytochrome c subunit